jgi:ribosomal protein S27E
MVAACVEPLPLYCGRDPHASDLWRLLDQHFETFRQVYDERFAPKYGFWRPIVERSVTAFLKCGDLHEGFARVRCPDCHHEMFVAFSCKQRCTCPSCHQKRSLILSERLAAEVFAAVAHRQFVFTVPKRLRVYFRFDRALLGDLARLAWETVLEVYRATLGRDDLLPGALAGIQTFGELIHWHPHIHALVTDGAFDADGTFHPLPAVAAEPFRELFAHKVLALLLARGKITPDVVENIRSWKHSGFSADKSVRIEAGDRAGLLRDLRHSAATGTGAGRRARRGR